MKNPLIVAARAARLPELLRQSGFYALPEVELFDQMNDAGLWMGPRRLLEEDETFRQLIPYVVLRKGTSVACYDRDPSGSEGRLHGLRSIGLGGHIEFDDVVMAGGRIDGRATVEAAARREVLEEVGELDVSSRRWCGWLIDHGTAVGRVHVGIVSVWDVSNSSVAGIEDAIANASFVDLRDLLASHMNLEHWSAMLVRGMLEPATAAQDS